MSRETFVGRWDARKSSLFGLKFVGSWYTHSLLFSNSPETEWCRTVCRCTVWSVFGGRVQRLSCSSEAAALLPHSLNRRRLATPHRQFGGNVPTSGTLGETRLRHFSYHITILPLGKRVCRCFLKCSSDLNKSAVDSLELRQKMRLRQECGIYIGFAAFYRFWRT